MSVQTVPKGNQNFKPDIVIKNLNKQMAWIVDPTIRMKDSSGGIEKKDKEKNKDAATAEKRSQEGIGRLR